MGFTNIGPSIDYPESAFADCLAGRFSRRPFLDCCVQSTIDPDMAPRETHHVVLRPVRAVSLDRERLGREQESSDDTVQSTLEEFFPGFRGLVEHREIVTPKDIEKPRGLSEGNIFAGELFRVAALLQPPAPGWNQYRPDSRLLSMRLRHPPGRLRFRRAGKLAAQQILRTGRSDRSGGWRSFRTSRPNTVLGRLREAAFCRFGALPSRHKWGRIELAASLPTLLRCRRRRRAGAARCPPGGARPSHTGARKARFAVIAFRAARQACGAPAGPSSRRVPGGIRGRRGARRRVALPRAWRSGRVEAPSR